MPDGAVLPDCHAQVTMRSPEGIERKAGGSHVFGDLVHLLPLFSPLPPTLYPYTPPISLHYTFAPLSSTVLTLTHQLLPLSYFRYTFSLRSPLLL